MANKKKETPIDTSEIIAKSDENVTLDLTATTQNCKIDDSVLIKVKSTFFGRLFYKNKKTGESTQWEKAGEIQLMTIGDLRAMKAEQISFFKNQWIVILGVSDGSSCTASCADVYKTLIINKFYENFIEPTDFKAICSWTEREIAERVKMMTPGAQENLIIALNEFIRTGLLDSMKKIKTFEDVLGCQLRTVE